MDAAIALYASAAVLLVIAGAVKVTKPMTAAELMEDLGAPASGPLSGARLAVVLGVVEAGLGIAALVAEVRAVAVGVGVLYVAFAATVLRAMALGSASCGCFGRIEAPPTWYHVVGNTVLAAVSFVAAAGPSPLEIMDEQPYGGAGFVILVGVLGGLALITFTALPEAMAARRPAKPGAS